MEKHFVQAGMLRLYRCSLMLGCDVCNHLSIFLYVANHDKLNPGWSRFAQFTIDVVNKDPKKSKFSDMLHRFWKKEHDWGWKKFMDLSKVLDGFVDADTLIIKAQGFEVIELIVDVQNCLQAFFGVDDFEAYQCRYVIIFAGIVT